jgi:hypothetical protein
MAWRNERRAVSQALKSLSIVSPSHALGHRGSHRSARHLRACLLCREVTAGLACSVRFGAPLGFSNAQESDMQRHNVGILPFVQMQQTKVTTHSDDPLAA